LRSNFRVCQPLVSAVSGPLLLTLWLCVASTVVWAQPAQKARNGAAETSVQTTVNAAIDMVATGKCTEALPTLKKNVSHIADKQLRYRAEMATVRCAMALDDEETAVEALLRLKRESPDDPEALYISAHYFSELGIRASQQLESRTPSSFQARKLQAESFESQGRNDEAAAIYHKILEDDPKTPGIHYRLGQIELAKAGDSGSTVEAKKEFQLEAEVDPLNASAHFILGELARRANEWDEAILQFSRASKLDVGFSEAYLALGMSFAGSGKFADAVSPLESYVKMQPDDPAGHYQLAMAYSRIGNREGAARELALQNKVAKNGQSATDTTQGHSVHP
jgi:tetratricopeptide (TPR) repeat protein